MTTLISQKIGGKRRSCNAQCYNAKHPTCCCICGGVNHQKGLEQAQSKVQSIAEKLIAEHGAEGLKYQTDFLPQVPQT